MTVQANGYTTAPGYGVTQITPTPQPTEHPLQLSIKFGPRDAFMMNIRGFDSATLAGHWAEFASFMTTMIEKHNEIQAVTALAGQFEVTPVPQAPGMAPMPMVGNAMPAMQSTPCPVTAGAMHEFKQGTGKTGKPYKGVVCNGKPQCAPQWFN